MVDSLESKSVEIYAAILIHASRFWLCFLFLDDPYYVSGADTLTAKRLPLLDTSQQSIFYAKLS